MADRSPAVDVRVPRVDNRHSFGHPVILDSRLHDRAGLRQMLARVDPEHVVRVQYVERQDLSAHVLQVFRSVGQVVFALGVAGTNLVESVPESGQLEDVAARVDLFQARSSGVQSRSSTIRRNRPAESRRMRPKPVGSSSTAVPSRQAAWSRCWRSEQVSQRLGPQERFVADQDRARALHSQRATDDKSLPHDPCRAAPSGSRTKCPARRRDTSRICSAA